MPRAYYTRILLICVQIVAITGALALSVSSFAWYLANSRVEVTRTNVTAAPVGGIEIADVPYGSGMPYNGQTGQGAPGTPDAPYKTSKAFRLTFPEGTDEPLFVKINSVTVVSRRDPQPIEGDFPNEDSAAAANFTWRAQIVPIPGEGEPLTRPTPSYDYPALKPGEGEGYAVYAEDYVKNGNSRRCAGYQHTVGAGDTIIVIDVIFLSESSFEANLVDPGSDANTPFAYSDESIYEPSIFTVNFILGFV